ncbi:hypothetical protein H5P28_11755 [Ruficoccus amylovorans]|uniref:Uncharacterized protein n=1 Tax=Ruficoccus amylovorans TaxID=1804625 RepID=A0A842HES3_9BACT|nr:hypothetical protein [Ruficoccus amylovorans]MBC2594932.1 hypothetical protein [Ruficoccus amylovorans]
MSDMPEDDNDFRVWLQRKCEESARAIVAAQEAALIKAVEEIEGRVPTNEEVKRYALIATPPHSSFSIVSWRGVPILRWGFKLRPFDPAQDAPWLKGLMHKVFVIERIYPGSEKMDGASNG